MGGMERGINVSSGKASLKDTRKIETGTASQKKKKNKILLVFGELSK